MRGNKPDQFFSESEQKAIISAIRDAERKTSGEIRVHVMRDSDPDIFVHGKRVFERLGMTHTQERNGVLIVFGLKRRHFAILGDSGIHEKLPQNFWDDIIQLMQKDFWEDRFADGMEKGIRLIGEKLQDYFPAQKNNPDELPDRISYGRI